ncbi:MAG: hypothetical protein GY855_02495 [candidate division Zixibacteria bacterium]|nr:hypothetical protein [candidate division Zixibacteria bacterium]
MNILVYMSILISLIVCLYRIYKIASTPVHLRWELYPVPHEGKKTKYGGSYLEEPRWWTKPHKPSQLGALMAMMPEILFLKGVWESNRGLWFWSWSFHVGLYAGIGVVVMFVLAAIVGPESVFGNFLHLVGVMLSIIGLILGTTGCLGVLFMRLFGTKMRGYSAPSAKFNLLFLLSIFVTGLWGYLGNAEHFSSLQQFVGGLITFGSTPALGTATALHVISTALFLVYMPFTHMSHAFMKYFTWDKVRWDDQPNVKGSELEKKINVALHYIPTWAAKHINADGKKTWADIATEDIKKDEK